MMIGAAVVCLALGAYADGTTLTWNGAAGASWEGANWLNGETPSAWVDGANAIFPEAATVSLSSAVTVSNLTTSGTLTIGGADSADAPTTLHLQYNNSALVFPGISLDDIDEIELTTAKSGLGASFDADSVMEYGYCTEFILQLMNAKTDISAFSKDEFVKPLEKLGDSIVAVVNDSIVKIHIHTFTPEKVLEYARKFGEFVTLKIENMSVQHSETQTAPQKEHVKYAIVAVASGEGIVDYFYSIGATKVIDGGQTNNPSVDDFIKAFDSYDAEHIIVLPNNSNIILTANQAAELYKASNVHVLPTKSLVEGYSALSMMNLWCDTVDELIEDMSSGLSTVTSAYVTTATRDTNMGGVKICKNKYIGIKNKEIVLCEEDRLKCAINLVSNIMEQSEKEVIIVFYGKVVSADEAEKFRHWLEQEYPLADIGFIEGKQDVYDYIISLE